MSAKKRKRKIKLTKGAKISIFAGISLLFISVIAVLIAFNAAEAKKREGFRDEFSRKADLLYAQVVNEDVKARIGSNPTKAGQVVFFSVGDMKTRAYVYNGTGSDLETAWRSAVASTEKGLLNNTVEPVSVKVDIVCSSKAVSGTSINNDLRDSLTLFYRYGLSFDDKFSVALTEAELNSSNAYNYEDDCVDLKYLNRYLKQTGRSTVKNLPVNYIRFQTLGWICDATDSIYELSGSGYSYGRRIVESVDGAYAEDLIENYSDYLVSVTQKNGKFDYCVLPRFDTKLDWYNIARHAGTVWSMISAYRLSPKEETAEAINRSIDYLSSCLLYDGDAAHIYWENRDDIELGADALALITFTEYIDVFGSEDKYLPICNALANGIIKMQDEQTGAFVHVLNKDFTLKEKYESSYYDGEAVYALLLLYGRTQNKLYFDTAKKQIDRFIAEDYTKNRDQWVSYAVNELTKYVDDTVYYEFGLKNIEYSMDYILSRRTPAATRLEQLMSGFELYARMNEKGISVDGYDIGTHLEAIALRIQRMLDGNFYPEIAMHMTNPQSILNTFMMRYQNCRVRIDEVQHAICGYYSFVNNYDKLVEYGYLQAEKDAGGIHIDYDDTGTEDGESQNND